MFKFNGGRGAIICNVCSNTIVPDCVCEMDEEDIEYQMRNRNPHLCEDCQLKVLTEVNAKKPWYIKTYLKKGK